MGHGSLGSLLNQVGLSFSHSFRYICFFWASIHFKSQSIMDRSKFLKPESMYTVMAWDFPFWHFFSVALSKCSCICTSGPTLISYNSFSMLFIHLAFLLCSFHSSHILLKNCFASFASSFLVCTCTFSTY